MSLSIPHLSPASPQNHLAWHQTAAHAHPPSIRKKNKVHHFPNSRNHVQAEHTLCSHKRHNHRHRQAHKVSQFWTWLLARPQIDHKKTTPHESLYDRKDVTTSNHKPRKHAFFQNPCLPQGTKTIRKANTLCIPLWNIFPAHWQQHRSEVPNPENLSSTGRPPTIFQNTVGHGIT